MKIKKIFLGLLILFISFLTGCDLLDGDAVITYNDPETGEEVELKVKATDDSKEVAKVIEALDIAKPTNEEASGMSTKVSLDIDGINPAKFKMSIKGDAEVRVLYPVDQEITNQTNIVEEVLTNLDMYFSCNLKYDYFGKAYDEANGVFSNKQYNGKINFGIISDEDDIYLSVKELSIPEEKTIEDQKMKLTKNDIAYLIQYYLSTDLEDLFKSTKTPSLDEWMKENYLGYTIEQVCDLLDITITGSSNDVIGFLLPVDYELLTGDENEKITEKVYINFGIDVNSHMLTYLDFDATAFMNQLTQFKFEWSSFSIRMENKVGTTIPEIKNKEEYITKSIFG